MDFSKSWLFAAFAIRAKPVKSGASAQKACPDSGEVNWSLTLRAKTRFGFRAKQARAARARRCAPQETAIRPTAESMPGFWKIERRERVHWPVADEQSGYNCQRRSSSRRSCAQRDSRPCGRAGAIAVKHSARPPREMPRQRKSQ